METYLAFVDQVLLPTFYRRGRRVYLIQDNASYHKKQETYQWFAQHRRHLEVFELPPYWPELTPPNEFGTTHANTPPITVSSKKPEHLCRALFRTFDKVRRHPEEIEGLIRPFC